MKKFIVILALVLNYSTQAQITITSADMPQEGMNYIYSNASTFGSFDLSVGEDVDWNYLSLDGISQDSMSYVSVDEAPFAYQFLFNNFFFPEYLADYALHIPDQDIAGMISLENNFVFMQNNPNDYRQLGMGIEVNDVPGVGQNNPIDTIYQFPMNYGNEDVSSTQLDVLIPGLYFYRQNLERHNYVDGWGTLSLPLGDYECLLVRTEIQSTDSIYIELLDFGFTFPQPDRTEYKWLANGEGTPVLEVIQTGGFTSEVRFRDTLWAEPEVDQVGEIESFEVQIFPNPGHERIRINTEQPIHHLQVFDYAGKQIYQCDFNGEKNMDLEVQTWPSGQYIIEIQSGNAIIRKKLSILH